MIGHCNRKMENSDQIKTHRKNIQNFYYQLKIAIFNSECFQTLKKIHLGGAIFQNFQISTSGKNFTKTLWN